MHHHAPSCTIMQVELLVEQNATSTGNKALPNTPGKVYIFQTVGGWLLMT